MTRISIKIAAICDWTGNRLYALATRFWNRAKRIRLRQATGAVDVGRQTYKGTSVRVIPVYDGINDESMWERASVGAGYAPLPDYIERHGGEGVE